MANFNKVILIGNLTRDPELRYTPSGTAVVNLRLAANHRFRDRSGEMKQETCFITVVVWDKQAESCNQYLQKGRSALIEGRLQSRSFQDNDGKNRNVIEVRADRVVFLSGGPRQAASAESAESVSVSSATDNDASSVVDTTLDDVEWPQEMNEKLT